LEGMKLNEKMKKIVDPSWNFLEFYLKLSCCNFQLHR
jgi:hypothetical protein